MIILSMLLAEMPQSTSYPFMQSILIMLYFLFYSLIFSFTAHRSLSILVHFRCNELQKEPHKLASEQKGCICPKVSFIYVRRGRGRKRKNHTTYLLCMSLVWMFVIHQILYSVEYIPLLPVRNGEKEKISVRHSRLWEEIIIFDFSFSPIISIFGFSKENGIFS